MPGASTANDFSMKTLHPLLHGVFEVDRPEGRRRGQQDDAARVERVDGLPVAVHADELPLRRHVDLLPNCCARACRLVCMRSSKTSAMAQSLVGPLVLRALAAAPVPRPPQPTRATLIVLLRRRKRGRKWRRATPRRKPPRRRSSGNRGGMPRAMLVGLGGSWDTLLWDRKAGNGRRDKLPSYRNSNAVAIWRLRHYDTSKGTIPFQPDRPLSAGLVLRLVRARTAENDERGLCEKSLVWLFAHRGIIRRVGQQSLDVSTVEAPNEIKPNTRSTGAVFFASQLFAAIVLSSAMNKRSPGRI